jgi:uracil-DNA glycosylase family 4
VTTTTSKTTTVTTTIAAEAAAAEPARDCPLCPRLVAYRADNAAAEPTWFNGPAPSFGDPDARLLIVGLAPGRGGANRTGRPFTGDGAGEVLYPALLRAELARGVYRADPNDGLVLDGVMITNAVRCAPPENKPTAEEVARCRPFLAARIVALPKVKVLLALGKVAHDATLRALGAPLKLAAFGHGRRADLPGGFVLFDSFHCSRYNMNTGRLTTPMFDAVLEDARQAAGL